MRMKVFKQNRYGFESKLGLVKADLTFTKDPEEALTFVTFEKAMTVWKDVQRQVDVPVNLIPVNILFPRKHNPAFPE